MLVYNADLFAAERMTAFLGHYMRLIHVIAREPRARIGDIQLEEPRAGRPAVAHVLRQTPFAPVTPEFVEGSIPQRFTEVASRFATRPAVLWGGSCWTYGELQLAAGRIAQAVGCRHGRDRHARGTALRPRGTARRSGARSAGAGVGLRATRPVIPTRAACPHARRRPGDGAAGRPAASSTGRGGRGRPHRRARTDASAATGRVTSVPPTADSLAYILYTSGSSGRPKGVMQSHRSALHHVRTLYERRRDHPCGPRAAPRILHVRRITDGHLRCLAVRGRAVPGGRARGGTAPCYRGDARAWHYGLSLDADCVQGAWADPAPGDGVPPFAVWCWEARESTSAMPRCSASFSGREACSST